MGLECKAMIRTLVRAKVLTRKTAERAIPKCLETYLISDMLLGQFRHTRSHLDQNPFAKPK